MKKYYQCRFEQQTPDGLAITVGWIEERGAKVGARIELKGEEGFWTVLTVSDKYMTAENLQRKQILDRNPFNSIKE